MFAVFINTPIAMCAVFINTPIAMFAVFINTAIALLTMFDTTLQCFESQDGVHLLSPIAMCNKVPITVSNEAPIAPIGGRCPVPHYFDLNPQPQTLSPKPGRRKP